MLTDHNEFKCQDILNNHFWTPLITGTNWRAAQCQAIVEKLPKWTTVRHKSHTK